MRARASVHQVLLVVGLAATPMSCGQNSRSGRMNDDAPVTTGLAALERGDSPTPRATTPDPNTELDPNSIEALAQRSAIDLERALAASPRTSRETSQTPPTSNTQTNIDPAGTAPGASSVSVGLVQVDRQATQAGGDSDAGAAGVPDTSSGTGADSASGAGDQNHATTSLAAMTSIDDRINGVREELRRMLVERAAGSTAPIGDLATAAALAAQTGAPAPELPTLAPSEQAAVRAIYGIHGAMRMTASSESAAPDAADAFQQAADTASAALPLRITDAKLCTRVAGFGDYAELDINAFLAGRTSPVIVYTQVDRFGSRVVSSGRQLVELSQELNIYHDNDGAHCWKRPAETVSESTRTRRRDFYLTNAIELPSTLTVGKYRLKITMRDACSGSVAETTLPFSIVADPALAHTAE